MAKVRFDVSSVCSTFERMFRKENGDLYGTVDKMSAKYSPKYIVDIKAVDDVFDEAMYVYIRDNECNTVVLLVNFDKDANQPDLIYACSGKKLSYSYYSSMFDSLLSTKNHDFHCNVIK